jgi:solute:Na+ symporter, SSS family
MVAASLFVVMRNIADGIRLLLTAIVLAAVYAAFQPAANSEPIIIASIVIIGLAMIIFTYFGGMEAVIWVEVVQLGIYIAGAIAAAVVLLSYINGGLATVSSLATQFGKC